MKVDNKNELKTWYMLNIFYMINVGTAIDSYYIRNSPFLCVFTKHSRLYKYLYDYTVDFTYRTPMLGFGRMTGLYPESRAPSPSCLSAP